MNAKRQALVLALAALALGSAAPAWAQFMSPNYPVIIVPPPQQQNTYAPSTTPPPKPGDAPSAGARPGDDVNRKTCRLQGRTKVCD
jgi:hypothetical protein